MKLLRPGSELRVLSSPMNPMGAGVSAVVGRVEGNEGIGEGVERGDEE